MTKYQENKEKIRQEAIEWQNNLFNNCGQIETWLSVHKQQTYFIKQGRKYGLLKEFKENGII